MPLLCPPAVAAAAPPPGRTPEARGPQRPGRVIGLDVARALAVFGMLGAHVGGVPADVVASPSSWLGAVHGRSSVLFAVLAGVSLALLTGRTVAPAGQDLVRARTRVLVRAAWVFGIGVTLEALGTDIDVILGVYGVLFVLALPFLRWSPRRLLLAAAVLAVLTPPAALLATVWAQAAGLEQTPVVLLLLNGPYPALLWWTFILVGMAVGRSDLTSPQVRARLHAPRDRRFGRCRADRHHRVPGGRRATAEGHLPAGGGRRDGAHRLHRSHPGGHRARLGRRGRYDVAGVHRRGGRALHRVAADPRSGATGETAVHDLEQGGSAGGPVPGTPVAAVVLVRSRPAERATATPVP